MSHSSRLESRQNPAGTEATAGPKVTDLNGNGPHPGDQQEGEHPTRRDGDVVEFRFNV
jgi:hypothetical protein